jgi:hypothetical protein
MTDADHAPGGGSPDGSGQQAAQARLKKVGIKGAPKETPEGIPKLFGLPPLTWVGKDLSRAVLGILAGSIVVLMGYLFYMEGKIGRDVGGAYTWALEASRTASGFKWIDRLESTTAELRLARSRADGHMSEAALQNAQEVLRMAARLPSLPDGQREQLGRCVPLPTDSSRNEAVDRCVEILERIDRDALGTFATTSTAGIAGDFATRLHEQRQGLHQFWIQAAQLILLNLLLPLLTALFGYIFGRQSGSESKSSE